MGSLPASALGRLRGRARVDLRALRPSSWRDLALCCFVALLWVADLGSSKGLVLDLNRSAGLVVAAVPVVAIAWRPRIGERLLVLAGICWIAAAVLGTPGWDDAAMMIGMYTLAAEVGATWRRIAEGSVFSIAMVAIHLAISEPKRAPAFTAGDIVAWIVALACLIALGRWIARRRRQIQTLVERARHLEREREILAAERDGLAMQAVAEERARIARELHDVVAHHVSVMVIQAGAAQASLPADAPPAAAQSIEAIRETGREALAEMRRMLGLLRSQEAGLGAGQAAAEGSDDRTPQPGLSDVAALVERTREAGVDVATDTVGPARRLPAGVDLSIYRVVQEALTNTLRHSGPGTKATLRLIYEPAALTVEVTDDGRGRSTVGSVERARTGIGHGLLGMRERVLLFGGRLETGPLPGGGFRVRARFPLEPIAEESGPTSPVPPALPGGSAVLPSSGEGGSISSASPSSLPSVLSAEGGEE